jgi:hypothetical protein
LGFSESGVDEILLTNEASKKLKENLETRKKNVMKMYEEKEKFELESRPYRPFPHKKMVIQTLEMNLTNCNNMRI